MHPVDQELPLYHLVAHLERDTLESWRGRYRPSLTLEGAMAQAINVVEITIARRPGGNILVTVAVTAKKAFECEVDAFRLQRAGNSVYKIVEPDETSS